MRDHAWGFHAGYVVGYIFYDCMHYAIHHHHPRSRWMKALRRHHLIHHSPRYADNAKFGVSSTLWDHVFGTYETELVDIPGASADAE